jgi:hypothetical protein
MSTNSEVRMYIGGGFILFCIILWLIFGRSGK